MSTNLVVVNADDFGESTSVNQAILKCFNKDLISSATLICNMPGFEEACEIIKSEKLDEKIGIHFNLSEGNPLTEKIKKQKKFINEDGCMYKSFKGFTLNGEEKIAVYGELIAQLEKCIQQGINPTHIDSHHHMHHFWGIGRVIVTIANQYQVPAIRLRFNWGKLKYRKLLYSKLYNLFLTNNNKAKTKYFCEIRSVTRELINKKVPIEVMVHPVLDENFNITNYKGGDNLEKLITKYLPRINFVSYSQLS